ncbi:MAG: ATP-dependent helicase [Candidatus Asgardarchaeia archaeon]
MVIKYATRPWPDKDVLGLLHPLMQEWFTNKFGKFTPPQKFAIPLIHKGENVLIFSPTGSGKTLSAFLAILNELYILGTRNELEDKVYCVYVSPLRALSNDIRRNLEEPLREITQLAKEKGYPEPKIRVAVRTGDTSQNERSKMLRKPPHILITTPESLAIVLNAPKFSKLLADVKWVIVDEVHELSDNKRRVHLSLSLERLQDLVGSREYVRIGLSATQAPIEEIAKWLVGYKDDGQLRDCKIVNVYFTKKLDIKVLSPVENLLGTSFEEATEQMYHLIKKLVESHRTILIFTNTRSGAERVAFKLRELFGSKYVDALGAHHSSLSKHTRLEVEEKLKRGEMKAVVTSTSLELGIDIGYIDLVIQIGSPKSVAKGLQRIGRAGHALNKPSKGRLIVFERDDLIECAVLVKAAYDGKIDRVQIPKNALDVLAQHIVGMSLTKKWTVDEAYRLIRRSYCYHELSRTDFLNILSYLSGRYVDLEDRQIYRKIWYDPEEGVFGRKRGSRMIYYLNLGTIPDEADYTVVLDKVNRPLGNLSEGFVERLTPGDVFVLGGRTYIFKRVSGTRVIVTPARGKRPTVPSWAGEMLPRSFDLSIEIGKFREMMEHHIRKGTPEQELITMLIKDYRVDENSAKSIIAYFKEQIAVANMVPTHKRLIIEEYIDPKGRQNIIFHAAFGRRTNDALSKAYAYLISKKVRGNIATSLTDNGFMLTLPKDKRIDIEEIPKLLDSSSLRDTLKTAIFNTELFKHRFRHVATRSFMILRRYKGHSISVGRQQVRSQQVLNFLIKRYPDFPILKETFREILEDHMDIKNAELVLKWIEDGVMKVEFLHSGTAPSPFAHSIILVGAEDVVIMEDRDALLRELHKRIVEHVISKSMEERPLYSVKTVERLIQLRQHLAPESKGSSKEDILKILTDVGPLYLFRERKPSIFERMNVDKEKIIEWCHELLKERKIISFRLPNGESRWIATDDFPIYYSAMKKDFVLDDLAEKVLEYLSSNEVATTKDLMDKFKVPFSELRLSLKVLEQNHLIAKLDFIEKSFKESVVLWTLTSNFIPELFKDAKKIDERGALKHLIRQYLRANGPSTVEEISNFIGHPNEYILSILEELENESLVIRGNFYPLKRTPQFLCLEDKETLDSLENIAHNKITYPEQVIREFVLRKQRLRDETKLNGSDEDILEVLREIGPVRTERAFLVRLKHFHHNQLLRLQEKGKVILAKGIGNRIMYMLPEQFNLLKSVYYVEYPLSKKELDVLNLIKERYPISRTEIAKFLGMSQETVKRITELLESQFLIIRWINESPRSTYLKFVPAESILGHDLKNVVSAKEDAIERFILEVIRWYSPLPRSGLKWLTKLSSFELDYVVNKLVREKKIVVADFSNIFMEEAYLIPEDLKKIENLYMEYLSGKLNLNKNEVLILSIFDPYSLRGIKQEMRESYDVDWASPILLDGKLVGSLDWTIRKETMYIKNLQFNIRINSEDLLRKIINEIFRLAKFYSVHFLQVESINSLSLSEVDPKIKKVFLDFGFKDFVDYWLTGLGSNVYFERRVIQNWLIRHYHFHPQTRLFGEQGIERLVKSYYRAWLSCIFKLVRGISLQDLIHLIRKKRLLYYASSFIHMDDVPTWYHIFHDSLALDSTDLNIIKAVQENEPLTRQELTKLFPHLTSKEISDRIQKLVNLFFLVKVPKNSLISYELYTFSSWVPKEIYDQIKSTHKKKAMRDYVYKWLDTLGLASTEMLYLWSYWPFTTNELRDTLQQLEEEGLIVSGKFLKDEETIFYMTQENFENLSSFAKQLHDIGYEKYFSENFLFLEYGYSRLLYFFGKEISELGNVSPGWVVFMNDKPIAVIKSRQRKPRYIIEKLVILDAYSEENIIERIIDEIKRDVSARGFDKIEIRDVIRVSKLKVKH